MMINLVGHIYDKLKGLSVSDNSRIGVALSGGADSVALFVALVEAGYEVVALHCNFNLRGKESDGDERYCRELASRFGATIEVFNVDTLAEQRGGESVEMACRRLRYEWFELVAQKLSLDYVAIAHHSEDCIETMLLNMLRGTGVAGMSGIKAKRDIYIRPMLDLSRSDIEKFLKDRAIEWRIDSSNNQNVYRRNALRNVILPEIRKYFPDADKGLITTARNASDADEMLDEVAKIIVTKHLNDGTLDLLGVDNEDMLVRCVEYGFGLKINHAIASDILRKKENRSALFATENSFVALELSRGKLALSHATNYRNDEEIVFNPADCSLIKIGDIEIAVSIISREAMLSMPKNADCLFLDREELEGDLLQLKLRHPRVGDRIRPFGMKGSRLVSDLLKEAGVIKSARRGQWVLEADENLLWVLGIKTSALYSVKPTTADVLCLRLNKLS